MGLQKQILSSGFLSHLQDIIRIIMPEGAEHRVTQFHGETDVNKMETGGQQLAIMLIIPGGVKKTIAEG